MKPLRVQAEPAFRTAHANPYNAALYRAVQQLGVQVDELSYVGVALTAPDIVHIHWPELMFLSGHRRWRVVARLLLFYSFLRLARIRGTRLVWTVHNIASHERRFGPRLTSWSERWLLGNVDAIICLTDDGVTAARRRHPALASVPAYVTPHGHYRGWYPTPDRSNARTALAIPDGAEFIVSVGQIRPYKNVPALLRASASLGRADVVIGVAGKPSEDALRAEIEGLARQRADVRLRLEFVPDEDIAVWLAAADLVVLPYRAIENSGTALLALSADRPIVVPDAGAMRTLQRQVGAEWVYLYSGGFTADVLAEALEWHSARRAGGQPDLDQFDWGKIAERTADVYRIVARRSDS